MKTVKHGHVAKFCRYATQENYSNYILFMYWVDEPDAVWLSNPVAIWKIKKLKS